MDDKQLKDKIDRLYVRYMARVAKVLTPEEFALIQQYDRDVERMGAAAPRSEALLAVADKMAADPRCAALRDELSALVNERNRGLLAKAIQLLDARLSQILTPKERLAYAVYLHELQQQGAPPRLRGPILEQVALKLARDPQAHALVEQIHNLVKLCEED